MFYLLEGSILLLTQPPICTESDVARATDQIATAYRLNLQTFC